MSAVVGHKTVVIRHVIRVRGAWERHTLVVVYELRATKGWKKAGRANWSVERVYGGRPHLWKSEITKTWRRAA